MIFMIFCEQQKRADFEETEWNKFNSRSQTFFRNDKIHKKENILSEVWVFLFFCRLIKNSICFMNVPLKKNKPESGRNFQCTCMRIPAQQMTVFILTA